MDLILKCWKHLKESKTLGYLSVASLRTVFLYLRQEHTVITIMLVVLKKLSFEKITRLSKTQWFKKKVYDSVFSLWIFRLLWLQ